jgi:hypothetical protein
MPVYDGIDVFEVREDLYFARRVRDAAPAREMLARLGVAEGPVLIKPNWFSGYPGQYTDAATLALFCDAVPGLKVVIEGHAAMRNDGSREITPANGRDNWDWLREQEAAYFGRLGLDRVLARDDVMYINVTDEVWRGNAASPAEVRAAVAERFGELTFGELYGVMPARLLEWRGRPLLSLARVKIPEVGRDAFAFSLSLKNMFGLIPAPNRGDYHERLPAAVVDAHALYGAFFDVVGVCEGVHHLVRVSAAGAVDTVWGDRYDDLEGQGVVVAAANPAEADAFAAALFGVDVASRTLMKEAEARLGPWDKMVVLEGFRYAATKE